MKKHYDILGKPLEMSMLFESWLGMFILENIFSCIDIQITQKMWIKALTKIAKQLLKAILTVALIIQLYLNTISNF